MGTKIIIVGGVAGGATAAARLRRLDELSHIILFERGEHISFANCGLPYYIGGTIKYQDDLLLQTVTGMADRYNLDIREKTEVKKIDRQRKLVEVIDLRTGSSYQEGYDYLILSPGAAPVLPAIKGLDGAGNVFTLRSIPDAEAILQYIQKNNLKTSAVIGGGFIGLEMAENLKDRGLAVTLIEASEQVQPSLDYEMACIIHSHLEDKGIRLIRGDNVTEFISSRMVLRSGTEIETDIIIIAIGVRPENDLALEAGLEVGEKGAIRVNEYLQTSDRSIYAIGDAIEVKNLISGISAHIPLAWPANRQGRLAADNIYGRLTPYRGTLGTSVAKVFDLTTSSTGLTERTLKKLGQEYQTIHIHPNSHAGYYPGAYPISMKILFGKDGRIFGAQAVGVKGAEKRIDVVATAIKAQLSVYDLQDLELAYAPPYSSAKDPVNMLGYVAGNVLDGTVKIFQYHEVADILASGKVLIDVREPSEYSRGKIDGSVNIPLNDLRSRLKELAQETIYIYCQVGIRGYLATRILEQNGFEAFNLDGGYKTYAAVYKPNNKDDDCIEKIDDSGEIIESCLIES